MKYQTLGALALFCVMTTALAACSYADNRSEAGAATWGKTDFTGLKWQSVGPRRMAPAWRKADAHARVIQVSADHSWTQADEMDTKGVVINGRIALADTVLTSGAYWAQPGGGSQSAV